MANAEQRIEAMTQIAIESSGSAPTQAQLTEFLVEGIQDFTHKIVNLRPDEAHKFAGTSSVADGTGITVVGKILSVVRENSSNDDVRAATPIPDGLRYLATDKTSLHYRSAENPCFYILNGKVYVLPEPASSTTQAHVSQTVYGTTTYSTDCEGSWTNFPAEYEYSVLLYAAAKSCQSAAVDIQNNMPTLPIAPQVVDFDDLENVSIPDLPIYAPPILNVSPTLSNMRGSIAINDFDKMEKHSEVLSKELDIFKTDSELEQRDFQSNLETFKAKLENSIKNADRDSQIALGKYRSKIYKYQYEITSYSQELQEKFTKYKWFTEQYIMFFNEYNQNMQMILGQRKAPEGKAPSDEQVKASERAQYLEDVRKGEA